MEKSETVKPFRITYNVVNKEGLSGLLTISYDTLSELQAGMTAVETWLHNGEYKGKEGYQPKAVQRVDTGMLGNCDKCGAPNKLSSKSGKPYCSATCWLKKEY